MKSFSCRLIVLLAVALLSLAFLIPSFNRIFFNSPGTQATANLNPAKPNTGFLAATKAMPVKNLENYSGSGFKPLKTEKWAGITTTNISLLGAKLYLPAGAITSPALISITALPTADVPALDQGMVNVTAGSEGYRFLPHGSHFAKAVSVSLAYDETKIPAGYTAKDIATFFFDEKVKHWVALSKDFVDESSKIVASTTTHFTDMIDAVIKVAESPETKAFTPSTVSGITPDPTSEIVMIAPPTANQMGTAALTYPIKLPAGRNGMEPELTIQYNSEGSNGWMGADWDLSIPFVSIETRWGVPRYDANLESETYTVDGAQLNPVAHRTVAIARTSEKQFFPRVNNDFQKITRHGNNPSNYWWEVIEKSGLRHSFGGTSASGVDQAAVLTDAKGNIAQWALTEDRDANNNFVKYRYTKVFDGGVMNAVAGSNLYLASITYTGNGNVEGKYSVTFTRDRELGQTKRKDVNINARLGFKQVTADLLKKIAIKFNGQDVRSYELNYTEGAFYKTLLQNIKEFDAAGALFTTHTFEYFNDVQVAGGSYQPLTAPEEWNPQNDDVHGSFINPFRDFTDNASALGGNKSKGGGFGVAVTVGPDDDDLSSKTNTVGVVFGFNYSANEGMLAMVDINGDGLVDKVYKKGGKLFYRANKSGPSGNVVFGPNQDIIGINDFDKGAAFSVNVGLEATFTKVYLGFGYTYTENINSVYLSDVNGDQLIDIVNYGTVYFNHIDTNGNPVFTTSSADTPSPIKASSGIDQNLVTNDPQVLEKAIDDNPLHDVVKVWVAPFAGTINISQPVTLLQNNTADGPPTGITDGVRVAIQRKGTELWSTKIDANDFTPKTPTGVSSVAVQKGDRVYFRVQSIFNGANDQLLWTPQITYSNQVPGLNDANALPIYQFNSDKDFLMSAPLSIAACIGGTIHIQGDFIKPLTSDSVTVKLLKRSNDVYTTLLQQGYTGAQAIILPVSIDENVLKGDELFFSVSSETNIDWTSLTWNPFLYYTASTDPTIPQVTGTDGKPLIFFSPTVDFQAFTNTVQQGLPWSVPVKDTFTIEAKPVLNPNLKNGEITFSVKKENELIQKTIIPVTNGALGAIPALMVIVDQGEKLFFEYHTTSTSIANAFSSTDVEVSSNPGGKQTVVAGLYTMDESFIFGPMYRHWGQFAYNGNRTRADQPIIETDLELAPALMTPAPLIDLSAAKDADEMQAIYASKGGNQPKENKFIYLVPDNAKKSWIGYDDLTYVKRDTISSSRMGKDDLLPINPITTAKAGTSGAVGIKRVTKTDDISFGGAVGPDQNLGGSISGGFTKLVYDFNDMNGDGYPDILSDSKIQYTHPYGGLEPTANNSFGFGVVSQSNHVSAGFTAGGVLPKANSPSASSATSGSKSSEGQSKTRVAPGISAKFNLITENEKFAFLDINGDGLPDRVYENGNVELNLGYSFLPQEQWGYNGLNDGTTLDYGGGVSINISSYSIVAGVSLARSETEATRTLQDMNGDGLPDYIASVSPLVVRINSGNGFGPAIAWTGANAIRKGMSTGEGINIAFTIGIHLIPILPVIKLCINPQISIGQGADRTRVQFNDINGDGYPDFLQSEIDSKLTVSQSTIQRTNKLKKVTRPLGGSFTLDYTRVGNTYEMPNTVWTLATVDVFDGVPGDGPDRTNNTFQYQSGHYDRNEREFYGFGKVITFNNDTENQDALFRTIVDEFVTDNFYEKGLLKSRVIKNAAGDKFNEIKNTYELKDVHTGATLPTAIKQSDEAAAFPALVIAEKLFYEGQAAPGKTTSTTYTYDALGNLAGSTDFGDPGASDDLITAISYHSAPAKYIMNIPSSVTVSGSGNVYRQGASTINNNTGNITERREFLQSGDVATTNMAYDVFGNLTSIARPANATGQRLTYTYEYDQQVQTYKTKTSDSYGYSSGAVYDFRFGKMLSETDLNSQQTQYTLDNAGRILTIRDPLEILANQPFTISIEYHPNDVVPWAMAKHFDPAHPANFIETAAFHDGLGRQIQTKKDVAIFGGPQATDQEVMSVSGSTLFNAFGRPIKQWYPLTEPKGTIGVYNTGSDAITPELMTYDVSDRTLTTTLPDQAVGTTTYGFGSDRNGEVQFKQTSVDANGVKLESFFNVRQLLKATKQQHSQGKDVWTSYNYNPLNELINVTDDQNNLITMAYDQLGRKTSETQPDAGTTNYKYDLAGNLTEKTTANLQTGGKGIKYTYDQERLSKITYPLNPQNNVTMTYGAAGAAFFRAGRLVLQQDGSGTQEFFYNPLGAMVKNVRVINVPGSTPLTFTTQWTYDTWNRLTNMVYPDGETLTYNYNVGGLVEKMSGVKGGKTFNYLQQMGYDKFETRIYMSYGNGTDMNYAFEPERRRLNNLKAKTSVGRLMMDNIYVYDRLNNIKSVDNNAPVPPSNLMGGKSTYRYNYDDLYRVTNASGSFIASSHTDRFTLAMGYNNLFSIVSKNQVHETSGNGGKSWTTQNQTTYIFNYDYNAGAKPNAPLHIGAEAFTYDPNGNQLGWQHDVSAQNRQYIWDEENRVQSLSDNGELFNYTYDASGARVLKSTGNAQTVSLNGKQAATTGGTGNYTIYVNPFEVVRSGVYTKHFYIDGQRIVSKLGVSGNGGSTGTSGGNKQEGVQVYYHTDHLGNSAFITDAAGEVYQHLEYFPFGETFIDEHGNQERTPYLYTGKELDEETDLYYYGARYYDPRTSLWVSVDPSWSKPSQIARSPYVYVGDNPVVYVDPDGLQEQEGPINITQRSLDEHVLPRHTVSGDVNYENKSKFNVNTKAQITALVKLANGVKGVEQDNGLFKRKVDAGRNIGKYRKEYGGPRGGVSTSTIIVITDKKGKLITAYPGPPKRNNNRNRR
ncbi:MAG: SpvB/TcaC N-terminal domain-containing protein [Chitinophagaceae bacterium]